MKIKVMIPFTHRNTSTGELTSYPKDAIVDVDGTLGAYYVSKGFAVSAEKTVTANGTVDVEGYASVTVNVGTYTVTYNANGGTGSVAAASVIAGNTLNLSDGTGLTPPSDKTFGGWATSADATEADVTSPYKPTANVTLYAVWEAE